MRSFGNGHRAGPAAGCATIPVKDGAAGAYTPATYSDNLFGRPALLMKKSTIRARLLCGPDVERRIRETGAYTDDAVNLAGAVA